MAVHWWDPENPQKYPRQKTINYGGPFQGPSKPQVKPGRNKNAHKRLEARQRAFDEEMKSMKGNSGGFRRPGSLKK